MSIYNDDTNLRRIKKEVERASNYYYHTTQQQGVDNKTKRFIIERCAPYIKGPNVLELGYVDGIWTDVLLEKGFKVDIVEGASRHVKHAKNKYSGNSKIDIYCQLFQEFKITHKYNTILAADIIRYLNEPVDFLNEISNWLEDDANLIVTVPNSRSFHRRVGTLLNLEPTPTEHNKRDLEVGNIRPYDRYELRNTLLQAGYTIETLRGCFLKPLSSVQMENWSDDLLRAFLEIGNELDDYCWFIYAICKNSKR